MEANPPNMCRVCFEPGGRVVFVAPGTRLAEAAALVGLVLEQACGGRGQCGRCRVIVHGSAIPPSSPDLTFFCEEDLEAGWRLACQAMVYQDVTVEIPPRSLAFGRPKILAEHLPIVVAATDYPVRKVLVQLKERSAEDSKALLEELKEHLGDFRLPLGVLQKLSQLDYRALSNVTVVVEEEDLCRPSPEELPEPRRSSSDIPGRESDGGNPSGTVSASAGQGLSVTLAQNLLDIRPGDHTASHLAVAFDIGTTTLVANLVDLGSGQRLAVASEINPQVRFGEDVISRIQYSRDHPDGTARLHEAVLQGCTQLVARLCEQARVASGDIYVSTFAGNTTMLHLLLGLEVGRLGEAPFAPVFQLGLSFRSKELGLPFYPYGQAYILPIIGPFVGGDTVAGMLAVRLWNRPGPALLVDIGTNGEIALSCEGKLYAAATAAGPAFEGVKIRCGMRAVSGAIERFQFLDGQPMWQVIGNQPPAGICGSGLVDLLAELLRFQIVAPTGRMLSPEDAPRTLPQPLRERLRLVDGRPAFVIATPEQSAVGQPLLFTQQDVRQLQLATGAIRTGVILLCKLVGISLRDVEEVWVAGAFGSCLRPESAQTIGLLPPEIPSERIHFAGNSSLAGATLVAVSLEARRCAEWLALQTRHIDLAAQAEFREAFARGMVFPEIHSS